MSLDADPLLKNRGIVTARVWIVHQIIFSYVRLSNTYEMRSAATDCMPNKEKK